jgi:hypothetical protein
MEKPPIVHRCGSDWWATEDYMILNYFTLRISGENASDVPRGVRQRKRTCDGMTVHIDFIRHSIRCLRKKSSWRCEDSPNVHGVRPVEKMIRRFRMQRVWFHRAPNHWVAHAPYQPEARVLMLRYLAISRRKALLCWYLRTHKIRLFSAATGCGNPGNSAVLGTREVK